MGNQEVFKAVSKNHKSVDTLLTHRRDVWGNAIYVLYNIQKQIELFR
jgi:hypothetical protein